MPKERELVKIKCCPHRLQLALNHSYKKYSSIAEIEGFLKDIANFFYGHSHKRTAQLEDIANDLRVRIYRYSNVFQNRWISSEFSAINKIIKSYDALVKSLDFITKSDEFDSNTRNKASKLKETLIGKNFVHLLHFLADLLQQMSKISKKLQKSNTLIASLNSLMQLLIEKLELLKSENMAYLNEFYKSCSILNGNAEIIDSKSFENYNISFRNQILLNDDLEKLSFLRTNLIDNIIVQLKYYFPTEDFEFMKIFEPKSLPNERSQVETYGMNEMKQMCKIFGLTDHCSEIYNDFKNFLIYIIENDNLLVIKCIRLVDFWTRQLKNKEFILSPLLRIIIEGVLTLPIGSAQCERGFSIMNYVKDKKRARLNSKTIEDLIRIKENGVKVLKKFNAAYYAQAWYDDGNMLTDDNSKRGGILMHLVNLILKFNFFQVRLQKNGN
jgi:hypothetical protein